VLSALENEMNTRSENGSSQTTTANKRRSESPPGAPEGRSVISTNSPIFRDARVVLKATLGKAELSVQDILALKSGSVVELDTKLNGLVELWLNGSHIARGEIVAVEDSFAVRIIEIAQL
jgi:flagellar motor switch protein FliN/FliY